MYPNQVSKDGCIPQFGIHTLTCKRGVKKDAKFFVVDTKRPAIGGLPLCLKLGLVILSCMVKETPQSKIADKKQLRELYPDRFKGIGQFSGEYHIVIDKDVPPVIHAARRCPINIKDGDGDTRGDRTSSGTY